MTAALIATHVDRIQTLLAKQGVSLSDLIKIVQLNDSELKPAPVPTGPVSKPVIVSPAELTALMKLDVLVERVDWPQERRELTSEEIREIGHLLEAEKILATLLERIENAVKPAVFNHLDVQAEQTGTVNAATPKDKWGYYATKGEIPVPDLGMRITREPRAGRVELTAKDLAKLEAEGEITHEQYLKWTRQTRVLDEEAMMADLAENANLATIIAKATTQGVPSNALHLRKE